MVSAHDLLSERVEASIRSHARRLSRQPGFSPSDVDDIVQQLRLRAIEACRKFRPSLGSPNAYLARVIENAAISEVRRARAHRRDRRRIAAWIDGTGSNDDEIKRNCQWSRTVQRAELQQDVEDAMTNLTAFDRAVAVMLKDGKTRAAIGRSMNLSRRAVNQHVARIRDACEKAYLREYLR